MIFLHLESFVNKLFELDFSTFQKVCFTVKPPWEGEFSLHGYAHFFQNSCLFPHTEKLLKVSKHFVEKIRHESTTLRRFPYLLRSLETHFDLRLIARITSSVQASFIL